MHEIEIPTSSYIEHFKKTKGAFSVCEFIALANISKEVPTDGILAEMGTHKGKSAIAAMYGLNRSGTFYLVEPEFSDDDWLLETSHSIQYAKKLIASKINPHFIADYSTNVLRNYDNYAYVFIDSGVHDDLVMEEVKMIEGKMVQGGIIAFHDLGNQFTAVQRAYDYLLRTGNYESMHINWELIFNHVRENNLEDGNVSWHERGSEEFPKFVGALRRK